MLEEADKIVFLYKIAPGPADRSYGIYAAKLAGLPLKAIRRARQILRQLENGQTLTVEDAEHRAAPEAAGENGEAEEKRKGRGGRLGFLRQFDAQRRATEQLSLFDAPPHPALDRLRGAQLDRLTPLDALNLLYELKKLAEK